LRQVNADVTAGRAQYADDLDCRTDLDIRRGMG